MMATRPVVKVERSSVDWRNDFLTNISKFAFHDSIADLHELTDDLVEGLIITFMDWQLDNFSIAFMFLVSLRILAVGGNFAFNHGYLVASFSWTVETSDSRCDISSSVIDSCRVVVELIKY
jgi:hypothetical protein